MKKTGGYAAGFSRINIRNPGAANNRAAEARIAAVDNNIHRHGGTARNHNPGGFHKDPDRDTRGMYRNDSAALPNRTQPSRYASQAIEPALTALRLPQSKVLQCKSRQEDKRAWLLLLTGRRIPPRHAAALSGHGLDSALFVARPKTAVN